MEVEAPECGGRGGTWSWSLEPLNTPLQMGARPISPMCFLCFGHASTLVNISAVWSVSRQAIADIIFIDMICFMMCHFKSICRDHCVDPGFSVIVIVPQLSQ